MPTTDTVTVKSSGGDYSSLSNAEANEQGNIVSADKIMVFECYDFDDTTAVTIDGWTTDATRYIHITVASGERHDGKWSTSGYRMTGSGTRLTIKEEDVKVSWVQLYSSSAANTANINGTYARVIEFDHCIIRGSSSTTDGLINIIVYPDHSPTLKVSNCILYDQRNGTWGGAFRLWGAIDGGALYAHNNTIHSCYRAIYASIDWDIYLKNNIFVCDTSVVEDNGNTLTYTGDYNATDKANFNDVTANTNDRVSQTFTFANAGSDDFHITGSDAGARTYGTDLGSDSNLPVTDDIDGDSRPGGATGWDIGAHQVTAVGTSYDKGGTLAVSNTLVSGQNLVINAVGAFAVESGLDKDVAVDWTAAASLGVTKALAADNIADLLAAATLGTIQNALGTGVLDIYAEALLSITETFEGASDLGPVTYEVGASLGLDATLASVAGKIIEAIGEQGITLNAESVAGLDFTETGTLGITGDLSVIGALEILAAGNLSITEQFLATTNFVISLIVIQALTYRVLREDWTFKVPYEDWTLRVLGKPTDLGVIH